MALAHLFARCPVLPVDAEISLARYLTSVEETRASAAAVESSDLQRAALLHIRVVQLVAKTLPSHPDRTLDASAPVLAKLDAAAHDSLDAIERITRILESPQISDMVVPAPLVDVFVGMVRERTARSERSVAVLATRNDDPSRVCALIVPAQRVERPGADDAFRHDADVRDLSSHKQLSLVGVIVLAPGSASPTLLDREGSAALSIATSTDAIAVVAAPGSAEKIAFFDISSQAVPALSDKARLVKEAEPVFKLYDLRSLAAARDAQAA